MRQEGHIRNPRDTYGGIAGPETGAGSWPLLDFWEAIADHRLGNASEAQVTYKATITRLNELYESNQLPENLIPEQIFPAGDERQGKGVLPLAWSHAKFVLATRELGIR